MGFAYVFGIAPERKAFNGQLYFGEECFGEGADSLEAIETKARGMASRFVANPLTETGRLRVSVRKPCATCGVTGVKPGCKRKACPDCLGRGTRDIAEYVLGR